MISEVKFQAAVFFPGTDPKDARNVKRGMKLELKLDRRGIADLIQALACCIDGADGAYTPSHHGTINIEMLKEDRR